MVLFHKEVMMLKSKTKNPRYNSSWEKRLEEIDIYLEERLIDLFKFLDHEENPQSSSRIRMLVGIVEHYEEEVHEIVYYSQHKTICDVAKYHLSKAKFGFYLRFVPPPENFSSVMQVESIVKLLGDVEVHNEVTPLQMDLLLQFYRIENLSCI